MSHQNGKAAATFALRNSNGYILNKNGCCGSATNSPAVFSNRALFISTRRNKLPWPDSNRRPHSTQELVLLRLFHCDDLLLSVL